MFKNFWADEAVINCVAVIFGVFHQMFRDIWRVAIFEQRVAKRTLEYTLVKHIGRRVFFLRVISDTFLAPKCDWTYRTFVKFNEAVILPVSAQMLGAREDFSRDWTAESLNFGRVGAVKFDVFSELELVGAEILAAFGTDERIAAHVVVNPTVSLIRTHVWKYSVTDVTLSFVELLGHVFLQADSRREAFSAFRARFRVFRVFVERRRFYILAHRKRQRHDFRTHEFHRLAAQAVLARVPQKLTLVFEYLLQVADHAVDMN